MLIYINYPHYGLILKIIVERRYDWKPHHDYDFEKEIKRLNKIGFRIVALLMDQHKSKPKSVAKYFLDIQKVANKSFEMLNENGLALFVIR